MIKFYILPGKHTSIINLKAEKQKLLAYLLLSELIKKYFSFLLLIGLLFFSENSFGQTYYKLITSTTDLATGEKYLISDAQSGSSAKLLGYQNTNNRPQATATGGSPFTISSGVITVASVNTGTDIPYEITINTGSDATHFDLYDAINAKSLVPSTGSNTNNYLKGKTSGTSNWTITFSSNAAVITNTGDPNTNGNRNIVMYNSSASLFSCYGSGQSSVYLYRKVYKVTYNGNGSTGGFVPTDNNYYFSTETFTAASNSGSLVKSGSTFVGWNTKADGSGTDVAEGATNIAYSTLTNGVLYAKWTSTGCTPPSDPSGSITPTANPACGSTTLSYSSASSSIYWQATASGTSTTYPTTSDYSVPSSGTYYVRAYNGTCWSTNSLASSAITINTAVSIGTSPGNQSVTAPAAATFSVSGVTGTVSGYQWQLNTGSGWNDISGATSSSYNTGATTIAMNGYQYRCIVKGTAPCADATSTAATLTVVNGPCFSGNAPSFTTSGYTTTGDTDAGGSPTNTIRLASGSNGGSVSTTATGVTAGNIAVKFRAKGWSSSETNVTIAVSGSTEGSISVTDLTYSDFSEKTVNFTNVPANPTITISTVTNKRVHVGNVKIFCTPATPVPEIKLTNNYTTPIEIVKGDLTPDVADSTDFGTVAVSGGLETRIFRIYNIGTADLNLSGNVILKHGDHGFSIVAQPASSTVSPSNYVDFKVQFDPASTGAFYDTIIIINDDVDESRYNFAIKGIGINSNTSDIIRTASYTESSNHDYTLYQADPISTTSNSIGVFKFTIRDGGASANDADALGTELTAITFNVTNIANIRSAALFGGATQSTLISNSPTINTVAGTISFSGLSGSNVTAADNSTQDITLRISYLTIVTDNQQLQYTIASATANTSGSTFATANAGGAASSITDDRNRIEVTATCQKFVQQPTNTTNGVPMSPAVTVVAIDNNKNQDLDWTNASSVECSTPSALTGNPVSGSISGGTTTIGSLVHTIDGTYTLKASASGLRDTTSNSYVITTFVFVNGDVRPKYDGVDFSWNNNWEERVSGTWTDRAASPQGSKPTGRILIDKENVTGGGSASNTYNDIIVMTGGSLKIVDDKASPSDFLNAYKKLEVLSGGKLYIQGDIGLPSTGQLIIRKGGEMIIDQSSVGNNHAMWSGVENFEPGSTVSILNHASTGSGTASLINVYNQITDNSNGAKFGNLIIDFTPTASWVLVGGGISLVLCDSLDIKNNSNTNAISLTSNNNSPSVTIKGNVMHRAGFFAMSAAYSSSGSATQTINFEKDFVSTAGLVSVFQSGGATASNININLKGNLSIGNSVTSFSNVSQGGANVKLNFVGTDTQYVSIYPTAVAIPMNVKTGAVIQLKNTDIVLNSLTSTTANFTVESNATLDFGFNGSTPLVVKRITSGAAGTNNFISQQYATLIITAPDGIINTAGTTGATGQAVNNQMSSAPTINAEATFWYKGKVNQHTGTGIGTASNGRQVIVDLLDNNTTLTPDVTFSITNATGISATGGKLDIRKGQFIETVSNYISGSTGTLYMSPGTLYKIVKGSADTTTAKTDLIPRMTGGTYKYVLNGGTIELTGTGANAAQLLRSDNADYDYHNLTFSGSNTLGTDFKWITDQTTVTDSLYITGSAIVDCRTTNGSATSFAGDGGLIMDNNARLRIKSLGGPANPQLNGTSVDYDLKDNSIIEFYDSRATQQQQLRGNYRGGAKIISYNNLEINADAQNLQIFSSLPNSTQLGSVGNVDINSSFTLKGTMNVNAPAVLRMDQSDFIYNKDNNSTVNINAGAGLLYASPYGITKRINPTDVGTEASPNPSTGNIRTYNRNFSTDANYGFVSSGNMLSGNALPASVRSLFVYRTYGIHTVTLNNGGTTVNDSLGLQRGKIVSDAANKLTLIDTTHIVSPSNVGSVPDMGYDSSYVIGKLAVKAQAITPVTHVFPIGSDSIYGPIAITPQTNTLKTYTAEYFSKPYSDLTLATGSILDHVSLVEHWDISSNLVADDNAKVKLYWRSFSKVSPDAAQLSNLRVAHYGTDKWKEQQNATAIINGNSTVWGSVETDIYCPDFSPYTIGTLTSANPLPVELISFFGKCNNGEITLQWATASEWESKMFIVQRSEDNREYTTIAELPAAGFSNVLRKYSYTDITNSGRVYYRLIEVATNGKETIHPIIFVSCDARNSTHIYYSEPKIAVDITSNTEKEMQFNVYEVSGKLLHSEHKQIQRGFNHFYLNLKEQLAKGIYIIQMNDEGVLDVVKVMVY